MERKILPDILKNTTIYTLEAQDSVFSAIQLMSEKSIGCVIVTDANKSLLGIFSERDVVTRVVAKDIDPKTTPLSQVMTQDVATIGPESSASEALELMRSYHCRHLPVLRHGQVIGMVSVRDLYNAVCSELKEDLQSKEAFIFSGGY